MLSYEDQVNMSTRQLVAYKRSLIDTLNKVNSELKFRELCGDTYFGVPEQELAQGAWLSPLDVP